MIGRSKNKVGQKKIELPVGLDIRKRLRQGIGQMLQDVIAEDIKKALSSSHVEVRLPEEAGERIHLIFHSGNSSDGGDEAWELGDDIIAVIRDEEKGKTTKEAVISALREIIWRVEALKD